MPVKSSKKQVKKAAGKKVQKAVKVTKKALQKTQKGGKKAAAKKTAPKKAAAKKVAAKKATTVVVKKQQRSFKVKLPNSDVYEEDLLVLHHTKQQTKLYQNITEKQRNQRVKLFFQLKNQLVEVRD